MELSFATNQGEVGGGEVMLLDMARLARAAGHKVQIIAPSAPVGMLQAARSDGFPSIEIHNDTASDYLLGLRNWERRNRSGWLWCNGLRPALATAGSPNRVVHLHQIPTPAQRTAARLAGRGAGVILAPSETASQQIPGSEPLLNWTRELSFKPHQCPRRPVRVGFLGRLAVGKGIVMLAAAMNRLADSHPGQFEFVLGGEPRFISIHDQRQVAEALAALIEPPIELGWVSATEFFGTVDLMVLPATKPESFGLVVAEAMAAGCPFVITGSGALPEVAGPTHQHVVPPGEVDELAQEIVRASQIDQTPQLLAARERWEQLFSPAAGRERFLAILDRLERGGIDLPHHMTNSALPHQVAGSSSSRMTPTRQRPSRLVASHQKTTQAAPHDANTDKPSSQFPRVAIAHDYLTQRGGAERVVAQLLAGFPDAEVSTSLYEPARTFPEFAAATIHTSPLNRSKWLRHHFRSGLPLYGWAFKHTPIDPVAEVVLCSTTAFAHGIKTDLPKIIYCHSPARFLYLTDEYLGQPWWHTMPGVSLRSLRATLIRRDQKASSQAIKYLCNSTTVQRRIKHTYGITAEVIPPPASLDPSGELQPIVEVAVWQNFYLLVSRLLPYKNVAAAIDAFRQLPSQRLLVVGAGPELDRLSRDLPANVVISSNVTDAELRWAYAHAQAVIAPSFEDYGLTPVEGFSFGKPTLALRAGGYLDTVVEGRTGYFFDQAAADAIAAAVERLAAHPLPSEPIFEHAKNFTPERFIAQIRAAVAEVVRG